jgi:hypothetical protein
MWLVITPEARREPRVAEFVKIDMEPFRSRASGEAPT